MASHHYFSAPDSPSCRPPSTASTSYKGSPTPVKDPFSLLLPPPPLRSTTLAPPNSQLTRPRASVQRRAAPQPSRLPPRPPVHASASGSQSAARAVVDSSGEPPSDLFFTSNRSTTPLPFHRTYSPPTSGAGLPESPTAASAAVAERHPLFPLCWATSPSGWASPR
jgi:hypothetical protein